MTTSPTLHRIAAALTLAGLVGAADTVPPPAPTGLAEEIKAALTGGTVNAFIRIRYEDVKAQNFDSQARAGTMRLALGYETKPLGGISLLAQYQGVYAIGNDLYNSTLNGHATRPVVLDPTSDVELHQAAVRYRAPDIDGFGLLVGRQEIAQGNQRFIGTVAWRQDWQAFDAGTIGYKPKGGALAGLDATYSYLTVVHRVLPDSSASGAVEMNGHAFRAAYDAKPWLKPSVYSYLIAFKPTPAQAAFSSQSTSTYGARVEGKVAVDDSLAVVYAAEYAKQRDRGDNPVEISASYRLGELGVVWQSLTLKAGEEILGGDSSTPGDKFTTPLATLHAFDGWADMFLSTPNAGLKDTYLSLAGPVPGAAPLKVVAAAHLFKADDGGEVFGREFDVSVECPVKAFDPKLVVGAKAAIYHAGDNPGVAIAGSSTNVDTTKWWLYTQYAF